MEILFRWRVLDLFIKKDTLLTCLPSRIEGKQSKQSNSYIQQLGTEQVLCASHVLKYFVRVSHIGVKDEDLMFYLVGMKIYQRPPQAVFLMKMQKTLSRHG